MARGDSGRIVLEIDPTQKDELYSAITKDGLTLKNWFLQQADIYLRTRGQLPLFSESVVSERPTQYVTKSQKTNIPPEKAKSGNRSKKD